MSLDCELIIMAFDSKQSGEKLAYLTFVCIDETESIYTFLHFKADNLYVKQQDLKFKQRRGKSYRSGSSVPIDLIGNVNNRCQKFKSALTFST